MNKEFDNPTSLVGEFSSKTTVHGPVDRPPRTALDHAGDPEVGRATELPTGADHLFQGVSEPRRLRRWSVAELVARAVARPITGGLAH